MGAEKTRDRVSTASAPAEIENGLQLLWRAWTYANNVQRPVADFAVEINRLRAAGLTECDLRWLICKQLVLHLHDTTLPAESGRATRNIGSLRFTEASCFVLTDAGARFTKSTIPSFEPEQERSDAAVQSEAPLRPTWDSAERELKVGDTLVKKYRVPAPNQERILAAFQEEKWPTCIDDPLPPKPEMEVKQRLHTAIRSLNRNQKANCIRFSGNGSGKSVCWHFVPRRRPTGRGS